MAAISPEIAEDAARARRGRPTTSGRTSPTSQKAMEDGRAHRLRARDQRARQPEGRAEARATSSGPTSPRRGGQRGDVDEGPRRGRRSPSRARTTCPVHTHAPLETHGVIAKWEGDQLTIYASTQGIVHGARRRGRSARRSTARTSPCSPSTWAAASAASWRRRPPAAQFAVVACKLAKQAGAPVKLMLDRHEEHLCTGNAPSALDDGAARAPRRDGTLTAIHHRSFGSAGIAGGAGTGGPAGSALRRTPRT